MLKNMSMLKVHLLRTVCHLTLCLDYCSLELPQGVGHSRNLLLVMSKHFILAHSSPVIHSPTNIIIIIIIDVSLPYGESHPHLEWS